MRVNATRNSFTFHVDRLTVDSHIIGAAPVPHRNFRDTEEGFGAWVRVRVRVRVRVWRGTLSTAAPPLWSQIRFGFLNALWLNWFRSGLGSSSSINEPGLVGIKFTAFNGHL